MVYTSDSPSISSDLITFISTSFPRRNLCATFVSARVILRRSVIPSAVIRGKHELFREVVESFVENCGHLICELRDSLLLERVELYSDAIGDRGAVPRGFPAVKLRGVHRLYKGSHVASVWGCMQRSCYSGHKRMH